MHRDSLCSEKLTTDSGFQSDESNFDESNSDMELLVKIVMGIFQSVRLMLWCNGEKRKVIFE
jgi:hypothetical protein